MEGRGFQYGFQLGDWLIEPRRLRVSRDGEASIVAAEQMHVLLCLVESKGEFVHRRSLVARAYADQPRGDEKLRQVIKEWHAVFGDTPEHPRYITAAGQDGYSLIAHFEPARGAPSWGPSSAANPHDSRIRDGDWSLIGGAGQLLAELRRRSVLRVVSSYMVSMWILLQVAEVTFSPLHLPAWWITALTILAVVGIPIMVVLAWTYEITPTGLARDSADTAATSLLSGSKRTVARVLTPAVIAGVVMMAAVTGYAWWESIS